MTRRDMVLTYLKENGSITKKEAENILCLKKNAFWSAIRQIRESGYYVTVYQHPISNPKCVLRTEAEWREDLRLAPENNPRLHSVWKGMLARCENEQHKSYSRYGGRGITVCSEWSECFQNFARWAYAEGYDENAPKGACTIDRIDNSGNYEPSNCRWVDVKAQANNRANNVFITYQGEKKTIAQWARTMNVSVSTLQKRLEAGWDVKRTLTTPVRERKRTTYITRYSFAE